MLKFVENTVFLTIVVTLLQLLTSSFAAYSFAKLEFKHKNTLFLAYIATIEADSIHKKGIIITIVINIKIAYNIIFPINAFLLFELYFFFSVFSLIPTLLSPTFYASRVFSYLN